MVADEKVAYTFNFSDDLTSRRFEHAAVPGFLSVIIPVYQDAEGLRDTLETLARQTLPADRFEVIVANDGGEESIHQLCVEFKTVEVVLRPNQGAYAARNAAVANSRGEFLGFTDADVILDPDWCAYAVEALQNNDIVAGYTRLIATEPLDSCQLFQLGNYFPSENLIKSRMAQTVNTFIRRSVFETRPWFDQRLRSGGDIEFTHRAGLDPSLRFAYDPRIKASHPTRNQAQLLGSLKRIIFGQLNVYHLIPAQRQVLAPHICRPYRLLFPPMKLYATPLPHLRLTLKDHASLYFFCWWQIKWRMFRLVLEAQKEWRSRAKTQK